jgi:hypothetical protein
MQVYSVPDPIAFAEPDYKNYDTNTELAREEAHKVDLKAWLQTNGWDGPLTGQILEEGVGDGAAAYMYADGKKACLIHLPYGDAYHSQNIPHLPKKEILRRLAQQQSRPPLRLLMAKP